MEWEILTSAAGAVTTSIAWYLGRKRRAADIAAEVARREEATRLAREHADTLRSLLVEVAKLREGASHLDAEGSLRVLASDMTVGLLRGAIDEAEREV